MSDSRTKASIRQAAGSRGIRRPRCGFTLVELLVVIGIIVILIGILIPTISHVRQASRAASTQSLLVQLQTAIEQYYQDFRAYPGPLSNDQIYQPAAGTGVYTRTDAEAASALPWPTNAAHRLSRISMAENMVLGLLGGLEVCNVPGDPAYGFIFYRASLVGTGPRTLAPAGINANRVKNPYIASTADLTTNPGVPGHFADSVGEANDSIIPEFVDRFQSPMPVLYLRARVGAPANFNVFGPIYYVISDVGNGVTGVRGQPSVGTLGACQYDINQMFGYVGSFTGSWAAGTIVGGALDAQDRPTNPNSFCIGEGKTAVYWDGPSNIGPFNAKDLRAKAGRAPYHGLFAMMPYPGMMMSDANSVTPGQAPAYFRNPAFAGAVLSNQDQPRGKDSYILIGPGPDRVYGTADDITSFGAVLP